jgi:hypothetical protein
MPCDTESELRLLQRKRRTLLRSIQDKRRHLSDLLLQQIALQNLNQHNAQRTHVTPMDQRIPLPFIVVNTNRKTVIECEMADNRTDIFFNFNAPFEIHDDNEMLKRMGMQNVDNLTLDDSFPSSLSWCLPPHVREAVDSASATNRARAEIKTDWWPEELTEAADSAVKEMAAAKRRANKSSGAASSSLSPSERRGKSSNGKKKSKKGKHKATKLSKKSSASATVARRDDDDDDGDMMNDDGGDGAKAAKAKRARVSGSGSGKSKAKRMKH